MAVSDLVVHQFGGGDFNLKVDLDRASVRDLKVLLSSETRLPEDDQILVYNGKTLSDSQTLKEAGINGDLYKVILGSKSFNPMGRPEDAPPVKLVNSYCCSVESRMEYDFDDDFTPEQTRKLCSMMWHKLKAMCQQISNDHLEEVATAAMEVHDDVMRNHRENYFKTFMDCNWEQKESGKIMVARRAMKKKAWLAEEAAAAGGVASMLTGQVWISEAGKVMEGSRGFQRPDIKEAKATLSRVKSVLVYKDEDELETGMQKVQPLPYLDEEIEKLRDKISDSVEEAKSTNDDVPETVLSKVNHVIQVAKEGKTTLFKASELLEFTLSAFQYARWLARDRFDLSRRSGGNLKESDDSFHQMLSARLNTEMSSAARCEKACFDHLQLALEKAESDCREWEEQALAEKKELDAVGKLEELKGEVKESISDEINELEMIRDQCGKDARTIDSEMTKFRGRINKITSDYKTEEEKKQNRLKENKKEQEELRLKLKKLEEEEKKLENELDTGQGQSEEAATSREEAEGGVKRWKDRILELHGRATTSLVVMNEMSDVTSLIITDAQKKQRMFTQKKAKLELESLLSKRDVLMAQAVMYQLMHAECRENINESETEIIKLEKDKKTAARKNHRKKVEEVTQSIVSYHDDKSRLDEKLQDASSHLEDISKALTKVDTRLRKLQPSLRLDKTEERYARRKTLMDKVFDNESTDGIQFDSRGKYH